LPFLISPPIPGRISGAGTIEREVGPNPMFTQGAQTGILSSLKLGGYGVSVALRVAPPGVSVLPRAQTGMRAIRTRLYLQRLGRGVEAFQTGHGLVLPWKYPACLLRRGYSQDFPRRIIALLYIYFSIGNSSPPEGRSFTASPKPLTLFIPRDAETYA